MEKEVVKWLQSQPDFSKAEFNLRLFTQMLVKAKNDALLSEAGIAKRISDQTGLNIKTVRKYLKK